MKNNFSVFYSWQSDIKANRSFIQSCIEKAIKNVVKKHKTDIELEINIDRDTRNKSGSPPIANTIFKKIETADIFICDVTIVNKAPFNRFLQLRLAPNPNVLIELGYAVHVIGWERVICICNTEFNSIEELPFDMRGHRITTFHKTTPDSKEKLVNILTIAVDSIVTNFESIHLEQTKSNNKGHDLNIYKRLNEICSETTLLDSISVVVNSLCTDKYYLKTWDKLQEFYKLTINNFIDKELASLMRTFLQNLDNFDTIITAKFHLQDRNNPNYQRYLNKKSNGETLTEEEEFEYLQAQTFIPHKEPFRNETWEDADRRIYKLQDELYEQGEKVKLSYQNLVMKIKQTLM